MKALIIDPPSGWKYGFPKPVPQDVLKDDERLAIWLMLQGYPEKDTPLAIKYSRYWEIEES